MTDPKHCTDTPLMRAVAATRLAPAVQRPEAHRAIRPPADESIINP
jgi:hypothetical protein